jgi:hypothetical protein
MSGQIAPKSEFRTSTPGQITRKPEFGTSASEQKRPTPEQIARESGLDADAPE